MLLLIIVGAQNQITSGFLLGFSIFYHFVSTKHELHRQQTDLIKAGFLFTLLFLPGANLFCDGTLFVFSVGEIDGVINYLSLVYFTITSFSLELFQSLTGVDFRIFHRQSFDLFKDG